MNELLSDRNGTTQPLPKMRLFNNWDAVAKGWYIACKSKELRPGRARSILLCGHQLVLFRGSNGIAHALDAFCPHMGLDLGLGKVVGDSIQCAFHGWRFSGAGKCEGVPCLDKTPTKARLNSYAIEEQYGYVWVYPDKHAPEPVFVPDSLKGKKIAYLQLSPLRRATHPHVPMLNGIDAQHVMGVHGVNAVPEVSIREQTTNRMDVYLKTTIPARTWVSRTIRFFLGPTYAYTNVFVDGTVALLNTMKDVRLLNRFPAPECNLIFSLAFRNRGTTEIIPVAVTERRPGLIGAFVTEAVLWMTRIGFDVLKAQEGEKFFRHMRFKPDGLLPGYDGAIGALIAFTNRQQISIWSRQKTDESEVRDTECFTSQTHGEKKCEATQ